MILSSFPSLVTSILCIVAGSPFVFAVSVSDTLQDENGRALGLVPGVRGGGNRGGGAQRGNRFDQKIMIIALSSELFPIPTSLPSNLGSNSTLSLSLRGRHRSRIGLLHLGE